MPLLPVWAVDISLAAQLMRARHLIALDSCVAAGWRFVDSLIVILLGTLVPTQCRRLGQAGGPVAVTILAKLAQRMKSRPVLVAKLPQNPPDPPF